MKTAFLLTIGTLVLPALIAMAEPKAKLNTDSQDLLKRAQQAKAEGRFDEARKLAEQLRKEHGFKRKEHKGESDAGKREKLAHLKSEIEKLQRAGKHQEAEELRKKFEGELRAAHKKGHPGEMPAEARLEHLMQAIQHLHAAGMKEPAGQLEQAAAKMREELAARHHHEGAKQDSEVHALREQVEKLKHALEEMGAQLKKAQPPGEVRKPEKP